MGYQIMVDLIILGDENILCNSARKVTAKVILCVGFNFIIV